MSTFLEAIEQHRKTLDVAALKARQNIYQVIKKIREGQHECDCSYCDIVDAALGDEEIKELEAEASKLQSQIDNIEKLHCLLNVYEDLWQKYAGAKS